MIIQIELLFRKWFFFKWIILQNNRTEKMLKIWFKFFSAQNLVHNSIDLKILPFYLNWVILKRASFQKELDVRLKSSQETWWKWKLPFWTRFDQLTVFPGKIIDSL